MIREEIGEADVDMLEELERVLGEHEQGAPHVSRVVRQTSSYCSSYAIDELDVYLADGRCLSMILKDTSRRSLGQAARRAKPKFMYNPLREIETYRQILVTAPEGTAHFYGAACHPKRGRYWLFIERVAGQALVEIGDFEVWQQVARWLANMHSQFDETVMGFAHSVPLLPYDRAFYDQWLTRARRFAAGMDAAASVDRIALRYDRVIERLLALAVTFLHGEFYAPNVLVVAREHAARVCPVDWEQGAVGPGLMDLGALVAGGWSEAEKRALAFAYYFALPSPRELRWDVFLEALDYCRLQLAVQWLGWSADWSPPPEHSHNWLREALSLVDKLEL